MSTQSTVYTFPSGLVLTRVYDPAQGPVDAQCGSLAQWTTWHDQLLSRWSYYTRPDGTNLFFEKVAVVSYSFASTVPFPNAERALALTYPLNGGRSRIDIQYMDPAGSQWNGQVYVPNTYRFPAALSHEFFHAVHNWCGFYGDDRSKGPLQEVARAWEKLINTLGHTPFAPGQAPWTRDPGAEQFANDGRALLGTDETRGSSGNAYDPVIPGFENPVVHADWAWACQLLPELSAFIETYGAKTDSLQWFGGWCWWFTTTVDGPDCPAGTSVFQNYYYSWPGRTDGWFKRVGDKWVRFEPTYHRT